MFDFWFLEGVQGTGIAREMAVAFVRWGIGSNSKFHKVPFC